MLKLIRQRSFTLLVALAMLVASTAIALSADARPKPVSAMTVVDAAGHVVGDAIDVEDPYVTIVMRVGATPIVLNAGSDALYGRGSHTFYADIHFTSPDCTGQAFVQEISNEGLLLPRLPISGQRVYLPAWPPQTITVRSVLGASDTPECSTAEGDGFESFDVQANLLVDLAAEFTPPYRLRLSGGE
jgi:hypothetical protein